MAPPYSVVQKSRFSFALTRAMPSSSLASNRHRDSPASSISFQYRRPTSKRPLTFLHHQKSTASARTHATKFATKPSELTSSHAKYVAIGAIFSASVTAVAVGCVWTSGAMATVAMLRGAARSAGERALQRSNASRPKRHTRSLDAPRRGTDASGETRARTTRARRATRADAKEGRARARGDGVEWLDRRIGSARRVGTRSTEDAIGATRKMKHGAVVAAPGHAEAQADPGPTTSPPIVTKEMVQAAVDKVARDTNKMSKRKSATRGASADGKKKPRKPYTQTRARVSWTPKEHQRFLRALELYSRDWKRIEEYVGSKDVVQIRSHAQKHFLKLMKSGQGDQMPPPRHKKSNHADGERAVNYVPGMSQAMRLRLQVEPDGSLPVAPKRAPGVPPPLQNSTNTPDFATVYGFLADLFKVNEARTEPEHALRLSNAHTTPLENMTAIDRETALLLIRNLRNNMCSKQMWQQQSDLLEDGCSTFLDAQDAERLRSKTFGKVSDASPDDNSSGDGSGDGSGGASNEALQSDIIA